MRILVVEDADMVRAMLRDALQSTGAAIDAVGTVAEGERCLRTHAYDWVILDHFLPDGNGLGLLRWLREKGLGPLAIFVTIEGASESYRREAEALGAVAVFGKPFSVYGLLDTIRQHTPAATPTSPDVG